MRDRAAEAWNRIRPGKRARRYALAGVLVAAAVVVAVEVLNRPARPLAAGHDRYLAGQQRLHVSEALVRLAVLRNAMASERPSGDLSNHLALIAEDLESALAPSAAGAADWQRIDPELRTLRRQIQLQDPQAVVTIERIEGLLLEARTGSAPTGS